MSLQVRRPSGRTQGMLNLSLKLGDVYQPSSMPGPSSAVAQTVKPNNNKPIMTYPAGYPNGYNQEGGSQYPQYPPQYPLQYPQSYPPVMGPAAPYSPPAGPYAVPPPPRGTRLFRRGLVTNILSAVRVAFDLAELDGALGGGGCGGGG